MVNEQNETSVTMTTNGTEVTVGTMPFYYEAPKVNSVSTSDRLYIDQRSLFEVHGENLFTTSITIEDCKQVNVVAHEKFTNIVSCTGFSSDGIKKLKVLNNEEVIYEKSIAVNKTQKPSIFSSSTTRINEGITSTITIFGENLVDSSGTDTISHTIYGCSETSNITIEKTLFSFDCHPDNASDVVYIEGEA